MNKIFTFIVIGFLALNSNAQISSPTAMSSAPTAYTNGVANDLIYIFCGAEGTGSLTATPNGGVPNWTFEWLKFNAGTFQYDNYALQANLPSSTISGLTSGGYKVIIKDANNTVVGCFRAWVFCRDLNVNVSPIAAGCGPFTLSGQISGDNSFTYYNPIPDPFLIDASTVITVCMTATHTYVSDLGFYLVGPASCGSPTIPLAPHPQAINSANGCCCNSGNDVNNLCFSTTATNMLVVCGSGTPLTGTYGIYGTGFPDNYNTNNNDWSPIFGCDATTGGWAVQIWDCIGADVGALTNASISFAGNSSCGPQSITYTSGNIFSVINDNSCSPQTASIFQVPLSNVITTPLTYTTTMSFNWSSPGIVITDSSTSLNPNINPAPTTDTWFYLTLSTPEGCLLVDSALFDYIPPQIPQITQVNPVCSNVNPFNLSVDITGGTWTGPGITNASLGTFNPATAGPGVHTIGYSTPPPCGGPTTTQITVNAAPDANFTAPDSTCQNLVNFNGGITTIGGGATITGFNWDFQNNGIIDINNGAAAQNFTYPSPGLYSVMMIANSNNGCKDTIVKTVKVMPVPTAAATILPSLNCEQTVQFNASSSQVALPYSISSFSWDFTNNGSTDTTGSGANMSHNYGAPGTYTASLTVTTYGGCTNTITIPVTVLPKPDLSLNMPASICGLLFQPTSTGSTILPPATITGYSWDFNGDGVFEIINGTASPTFNFSQSGNFNVTLVAIGSNGCSDTTVQALAVNSIPGGNVTVSPTINCNQTVTLTANIGNSQVNSFGWDFDGNGTVDQTTVGNGTNHNYPGPGTYNTQVVLNGVGACESTLNATVVVNPVPSAQFTYTPASQCSMTINFDASGSSVGNPSTIATYAWDFTNNGSYDFTGTNPNTFNTYPGGGTYTVKLKITTNAGCVDSIIQQITIFELPNAAYTFSPVNICNQQVTFDASGTTVGSNSTVTSFNWDFTGDGVTDLSDTNPVNNYTFPSPGTYNVTLIVISTGICHDTISQTIVVNPVPAIQFNIPSESCNPQVLMDATGTTVAAPSTLTQPTWDFNGDGVADANGLSNNHTFPGPGTYNYTFNVNTSQQCPAQANGTIIIHPQPDVNFNVQSVCESETANFTNQTTSNGGNPTINYAWDFGDGGTSNQTDPTHNFSGSGTYNVTLTATTNNGCTDVITLPVNIRPDPVAAFLASPDCYQIVAFISQSSAPNSTIDSVYWSFGDGTGSNDSTIIKTYSEPGNYVVTLVVTNTDGCISTITQTIEVKPSGVIENISIPNIITPNGDNMNDELKIDDAFTNCNEFEIQFFNRWGNKVYTQTKGSLPFPGGKKLEAGVYFYVLTSGNTFKKQGNVTIANN